MSQTKNQTTGEGGYTTLVTCRRCVGAKGYWSGVPSSYTRCTTCRGKGLTKPRRGQLMALLAKHWAVGMPRAPLAALRYDRIVKPWVVVTGTRGDFERALEAMRKHRHGLTDRHERASATSCMKKLAEAIAEAEGARFGWTVAERRQRREGLAA